MDIINNEKKYPTLVEVVNNSNNPTTTEVKNFPLNSSGTALNVSLISGSQAILPIFRPNTGNYHVFFDNITIIQSNGGFFAIPLSTWVFNITQNNLTSALSSYKTAYSVLVSGVTAAKLHYSKLSPNGALTSEVFDLKE